MDSLYEKFQEQRKKDVGTSFAGFRPSTLQAVKASLAQPKDDEQEIPKQAEQAQEAESQIATSQNAQIQGNAAAANPTDETSPNTKSVMFEHLKQDETGEQEKEKQEQQTQEHNGQQGGQLTIIKGIGHHQHKEKHAQDIRNEYAKMRENPDLLLISHQGKPMLLTTRELFERHADDSIEEQIEFAKNAINYTQSFKNAEKQGKNKVEFIKELGLPLSIEAERHDRLRQRYDSKLLYLNSEHNLIDEALERELREAYEGVDTSGILEAPFKFFGGLLWLGNEGSIALTKDQSVEEQRYWLSHSKNKQEFMRAVKTFQSNLKENSLLSFAHNTIKGNEAEIQENKNKEDKRTLEWLQKNYLPSITNAGRMQDGSFFVDFPDNQRIFFKDDFLTYLDTTIANNQMEVGLAIAASAVALPAAAAAGAGAIGTFVATTAAGAFGSGLGAWYDFNRIAANNPLGTYTSEDRNAKILDAVALSIAGDTILGGAIYGAKAAWRAIPTAEKGGKRYAQKHSFFSEDVESKMATQDKYFTIDKARQGFWGRLVHGGVKDEGFLNRLEAGLQSESVSPTAKRLSPVMNDTIADNVFDTNKKAELLFDSLLRGDHNRVAQLEKDIAEITQDLKNRFNALEDTLKEHVQITGAIPESFIEKVERDVARTISATDSRLHSTLDDIFGLMRNAGNVKDLIEIEKFVGQALVENYKHYSAKKILNHLQYNISKTIDDSIKSTFKNMPELGENLIKQRAALKAEWRNFAFQKSRVGFDEMSQSFRQHQNLDNFVHAAQANVTHDDVLKGFAKEPQKRTSYSIGEKEMSESELESFLQTLGKGRENVELIVLNGIVHRAEKKIGKDFVVDNMSIYHDLKSINPNLFKSEKGRQAYQILDELATQFKHNTEILRFAGRDVASEEWKYWGIQPLVFKIASRFLNSLRARFSEEAGFRYCLQLAMERKRSFKEIGEILAEQSENPKLTPQDKHALLETSKLMLKTWQEREKEIAKKEAAEKKAREKLKREKLAKDKENLLKTSGDVGEDILPKEDLGTRIENADTMIFTDKDKGYAASYQIVDLNQLSTSFEYGTNYQFREIKQTQTIHHIRDNFDPKLIFTREGGFDGLPLVDNKGRTIVGNHRLEALLHLDDEAWESYAKEAFLKYGAKLERGELLVRVLAPDVSLQERIAIAKASNDKRANTNSERNLIIIGKYAEPINHLVNGKSPVQPAFKDAANVHAMRALVAAAMNEPLEKELTNRALLLYLCPDFVTRNKVLERTMPDVAEIIQKMLDDNAGALFLNALSPNAKNIDISKYLSGALGRIAEARKFDKQRRERFLQNSVENLHIDFRNIYDSEQINGVSYFEQFKSDLIALALARFSKRDNPSENLYKFLKEIGETQEHSADNLFGEEYATTLWDNLLRINRIDLENGEDAITLNIKKILEREKAYLAYKQQRERTEQQLEQCAFHNELLSSVQGKNALQFAMQTKMFGTQSEQNIAQEILAKQGYYLNHDGTLSLIEGKAKPKNPIETIREQAVRLYGNETPFMQDMREGFTNNETKQKWWIVPRGQHSIVEYAKEIDPNLVRFESAEVGSWFADFQGIVHKVALKNQDTLAIEHYISNEIPPAKTWFFKNENQTTHLMQAYNGEVLLIDMFNNDNTRTILAKQHGKVFKTTIDENGTKETKEETAKSIELFSRFLQESEGIETAGKGKANLVTKHADVESERLQEIAKSLKEEYPNYSQERVENASSYIATRFPNYDSKTAIESWELSRNILDFSLGHDEKELANFAYNIAVERHKLEQLLKIEPIQEFGTNYAEFYHNGIYAIQKVMQEKQGQVSGAFYREDLGDITITWGEVTDANKHKGYGLAHIVDKHPDMNVNLIAEIVEKGKLNIQNDVRARLEYGDYVVGLSREFKGEKVNFIITAFEKSNGNKGSLSPKPKITDESDNVSPTHTDDSTPPPIKDSLENGDVSTSFQHDNSRATEAPPKNHTDTSAGKQAIDTSTQTQASPNFFVSREFGELLAVRDKTQRLADNIRALEVLGKIAEGAPLSSEALEILARYSGFGGLKVSGVAKNIEKLLLPIARNKERQALALPHNALDEGHIAALLASRILSNTDNSYYTPYSVISALYEHLDFAKGRVLETSMGTGNFYTAMPRELYSRVQKVGVDLDPISALIGKTLSGDVDVRPMSFYDFKDQRGFDIIIGNPPYGHPILQDFVAKAVENAKENGLIIQVVSSSFLDNAASLATRAKIAKHAEFLGAVRLPSNLFSGTDIATDIVVFQKRSGKDNTKEWVNATQYEDSSLLLNNYYHSNREFILGRLEIGSTQYGERWRVVAKDYEQALHEKLAEIFKRRLDESDAVFTQESERESVFHYVYLDTPNTFYSVDGKVYQTQRYAKPVLVDFLQRVQGNGADFESLSKAAQTRRMGEAKKAEEMAQGYLHLRNSLLELRSTETMESASEESLFKMRKNLNHFYDSFVSSFGKVSENKLFKKVFGKDPSFSQVIDLDARGRHKILDERVSFPYQIPSKAKDLQDAITLSKSYAGRISEDYIHTLLGDRTAVQKALANGELFADAKGNLFTKEDFIVGDLGARIDALRALGELDSVQTKALETLEAALPEPLKIKDIYYSPSSRFIPNEAMMGFFDSLGVRAEYFEPTKSWMIDPKSGSHAFLNDYKAITDNMGHSAIEVLESLLQNKELRWKKQKDGIKESYPEQFAANKMAQNRLLENFYDYMQKHHAKDIADTYNHKFRRMVANDFQAEPLLHGLNPEIQLHPHQKSAVSFAIAEPNVLLDHSVGAGKTYEMIAIASEWKRLGISKNPLFVVPNHLVQQWAQSFAKFYPSSRVLTIPTDELGRKRTLAMLANGGNNFDAVIMPHSTFDSIQLSYTKNAEFPYDDIKELDKLQISILSRQKQHNNPKNKRSKRKKFCAALPKRSSIFKKSSTDSSRPKPRKRRALCLRSSALIRCLSMRRMPIKISDS